MTLTLRSPAKVNLFLRVLKRREDEYHELASLFQTVDLCDTLYVTLEKDDFLTCSHPKIPTDSSNLVLKAAALFRKKTGLPAYAHFHIEKHIPFEAGLGGGSSNAATALWALNVAHGFPASAEQMAFWAGEIGSDVAFFLSQGTAYCTGRGEQIRPITPLKPQTLTIVKPSYGLSTPFVYKALDVRTLPQRDPEKCLHHFLNGNPLYFNDLESSAFLLIPALVKLKEDLLHMGFSDVVMSGSGTSFFCLGEGNIPAHYPVFQRKAAFINRSASLWY